jgi:ABC-type Na+ efflux pump permease subunit
MAMGRSLIVKLFFGSLIGFVAGAVVLVAAGAVAVGTDVFVMNGPDVVGINSGPLTWTVIGLMALASLIMILAALAQVVAWIGAVLDTATRPDKTWLVALLVLGLLGFGFVATLIYVLAGRDETPAQTPIQPNSSARVWTTAQTGGPVKPNGQLLGSGQAGGQPPASG